MTMMMMMMIVMRVVAVALVVMDFVGGLVDRFYGFG